MDGILKALDILAANQPHLLEIAEVHDIFGAVTIAVLEVQMETPANGSGRAPRVRESVARLTHRMDLSAALQSTWDGCAWEEAV